MNQSTTNTRFGHKALSAFMAFVLAAGICIPTAALGPQKAWADASIAVNQTAVANSLASGAQYVITANNYALASSGTEVSKQAITTSEGSISLTGSENASAVIWTWKAANAGNGTGTLTNGGKSLSISSGSLTLGEGTDNVKATYASSWTITDSNGSYYLALDTQSNTFTAKQGAEGENYTTALTIYQVTESVTEVTIGDTESDTQTINWTGTADEDGEGTQYSFNPSSVTLNITTSNIASPNGIKIALNLESQASYDGLIKTSAYNVTGHGNSYTATLEFDPAFPKR